MTDQLVSVVVVNFNYGRYLAAAIESALAQHHDSTEVIVVDDGSTDESRSVIAHYGGRIRSVLKENAGQASACNAGFIESRGNIVVFLDADDQLLPDAATVASRVLEDSGVTKMQWPLEVIDERGDPTGAIYPGVELSEGDFRNDVIKFGPYVTSDSPMSGNAWARGFLNRVAPITDPGDGHGADAYLCALAPLCGGIRSDDVPHGKYRRHALSFSKRSVKADLVKHVRRFDFLSSVLQQFLLREGIPVDSSHWKSVNERYKWMLDALSLPAHVAAVVPSGERFVLVEAGGMGPDLFPDGQMRTLLPDGNGFGREPFDLDFLIGQLVDHRRSGTRYAVIPRASFWWLHQNPQWRSRMNSIGILLHESPAMLVFDLGPITASNRSEIA